MQNMEEKYTKFGGETSRRPFFEISKLSCLWIYSLKIPKVCF